MWEILAWCSLAGMTGFGIGRLRFHAVMQSTFKMRRKLRYERVHNVHDNPLINVWISMYEQTLQTARELQKSYITAGTVGLAAAATILARTDAKPVLMYASATLFLIAIISAFSPLSFTTIRLSKDLSKLSRKLQRDPWNLKPTLLPQALRRHRHPAALIVALVAFGAAVVVFSMAISAMIACASPNPDIYSLWLQCV